jgi:16S rRNA (cytosine967-C5)-methyltransferase
VNQRRNNSSSSSSSSGQRDNRKPARGKSKGPGKRSDRNAPAPADQPHWNVARMEKRAHKGKPKPSNTAFPPMDQREPPLGDAARHAVFRVLARQCKLYPDFDLSVMEKSIESTTPALSDLDRAFAFAIYDAVVRRWLTLEYLLSRCLTQPWEDLEHRLQGALLGAAAQILFLDKVPTHSAINHAVEWAKIVIRPGAGSMANAVLRRFAKYKVESETSSRRPQFTSERDELPALDGSAIVLSEPCLPEPELERLAVATSHPLQLLEHWLRDSAFRDVRKLALHSMMHPPVIINTAHALVPPPSIPELTPHAMPGHMLFSGAAESLRTLLAGRNDLWVQDPASALAIQSISDLRPSLILDLCAGQGTKTRQLAATFPNASIVCSDIDDYRMQVLNKTFASHPQITPLIIKKIREKYIGKADLILLDVPCSNTGVLARRPEAKIRLDDAHMKQLIDTQRQIIADSLPLLTGFGADSPSRGRILYSTCSLESEENQKQAQWADKWHTLGISRDRRQMPEGGPTDPPTSYCDGSFAALLG